MTILRRILTGASLAVLAAGFASANSITYATTYGFDSSTGLYTVTQTGTLASTTLNITSGASLFSFGSFNSLAIAGATYAPTDSTFDYEYTNTVTSFQITNHDTGTDTINATVQSLVNVDAGTNMPSSNGSGDRKNTGIGLGFGFSGNTPTQQTVSAASTPVGGVTLTSGQTYTYPSLPVVTTIGIGYDAGVGCGSFGNTSATSGCNVNLANTAYQTTGFTYGLTDTQQFADSLVGAGSLNLTIVATTNYTAKAEVTYEYSLPASPTPEPATMAMMGGALIALSLIGKRFRTAKKS